MTTSEKIGLGVGIVAIAIVAAVAYRQLNPPQYASDSGPQALSAKAMEDLTGPCAREQVAADAAEIAYDNAVGKKAKQKAKKTMEAKMSDLVVCEMSNYGDSGSAR